ncbi:glutathione-regulated potassium-efflux system oxidoreductase KefF [Serratia sp. JSRIV001]|uniref:glutathione-regulated potassium-efflux system oxidoreductase KefF n=1 Tax=Serratia TaxID=613 RepID=UPI0004665C98|nr:MULTISPECIES: glutathione-regulated potassium-efflux system oxidoreductase KefF [Serratia]UAN45144.1 glutathione-regulated potassium-efflux system oxidoreductase KefF [Serratia sp. JSRIV001]UAN50651.1 glutathione-regulated potassium-efflux system oxidoreductase KefF [Serratia sp. JSRIV002]UAN56608.1 glutathione-regulated potassium-efflux system oxidoreductase KefF [Serratia sp. JSRIV004]UAN62215.1 glutathione-regulated potassium-efflux system oxidoreductase KefF [Serratia sp. JSRIV006]
MILIIYAHPYPRYSRANENLLEAVKDIDDVEIRSLYDIYPDFNIDIKAEQHALASADIIVLQHPMQWYSLPPLLKLWIDKVLEYGWAYGHGGNALLNKWLLWAVTSGGAREHFAIGEYPHFDALAQPLQATAIYCGMKWLPPFSVHNTYCSDDNALAKNSEAYRNLLLNYQSSYTGDAHREENYG